MRLRERGLAVFVAGRLYSNEFFLAGGGGPLASRLAHKDWI